MGGICHFMESKIYKRIYYPRFMLLVAGSLLAYLLIFVSRVLLF